MIDRLTIHRNLLRFTPVAIGGLLFSLIPAVFWPVPILLIYSSIAVGLLTKFDRAWIAPIILALFPRFWNDTTLATGIATGSIGLFLLLLTIGKYGQNSTLDSSLFFKLFHRRSFLRIGMIVCIAFSIGSVILSSDIPLGMSDPILWEGRRIEVDRLPWYYFLRWFSITTPIFFQITTLLGIIGILFSYKKTSFFSKALFQYTILQFILLFTLPLRYPAPALDRSYSILLIYNMAVLSSFGLIWIWRSIENRHLKILLGAFIAIQFLPIFIDIRALYPYQGNYFNRTYGGLKVAYQKQELHLPAREVIEWLTENIPNNSTVLIKNFRLKTELKEQARARFKIANSIDFQEKSSNYYYSIVTANDYPKSELNCSTIHSVVRQKSPIIIIQKCP